jgi:anhydro-N-acetylmuramic acid kinase
MNQLQKLVSLQDKQSRIILGLMSGTSIDGLDLALCKFKGFGKNGSFEILHHTTKAYDQHQKSVLRNLATSDLVNMEELCIYHTQLSYWHAKMVNDALFNWGFEAKDVDLIATHGQTIRHAPKRIHHRQNLPNSTFQLGEADHLSKLTGIITIHDLRQKHVAAGGEGAPLAVYGDQLLFPSQQEFRILLNIGGISNLTVLVPDDDYGNIPLTFDTGPGNTLMDLVIRKHFTNISFDVNGDLASKGNINNILLQELKNEEYFRQSPPKTTGPELLSEEFLTNSIRKARFTGGSLFDLLATLNRFTAETIADAIHEFVNPPQNFAIYISGGGAHNFRLIQNLKELLPNAKISDFIELGVHPDAKEALFFAALANELVCGQKIKVQTSEGTITETSLGKISFPD